MIPKKIHYCWFGKKPLPKLAKKCMASWKKYCPDYEIIKWNEHNFDINYCSYTKEAYEMGKYAFVSDVARLYALVNQGGIYMDFDVEIIRPIDAFLKYKAFSGFETDDIIQTGIMACEQNFNLFKECLLEYEQLHFIKKDGSFDITPNTYRITNTCVKYGLQLNNTEQNIKNCLIFPKDYFCPKNYNIQKLIITENTYSIHHFYGSWYTLQMKTYNLLVKIFGDKFVKFIVDILKKLNIKNEQNEKTNSTIRNNFF